MSIILFFEPSMWSGVNGDAPVCFSRKQRARTRCTATTEIRNAILSTQWTVGLLSLNSATWRAWKLFHTSSMINQRKRRPAISKSEFVRRPVGFTSDTTSCMMSSGHW